MNADERKATIVRFVEQAYSNLDKIDYFRLLQVSSSANTEELRRAYYQLAMSIHPDIHGHEVEVEFRLKLTSVFSRVVEAYRVLIDPETRRRYEQGLGRGELRFQVGAKTVDEKPEAALSPSAQRFYRLAAEAREAGDIRSAKQNLQMALTMEPDSELLRAKLAELG